MEPRLIFDPSEASAKQSSAHLAKYHKIFSFAQPGRTAVWGREGGVCFPKICGVNSATLQKLIFAHVTSFCTLQSPADFIHLDNMFPFKHLHCALRHHNITTLHVRIEGEGAAPGHGIIFFLSSSLHKPHIFGNVSL